MELDDLKHGLRIGISIQVIADFIQREADEVRQKADELGILPDRKRLPDGLQLAKPNHAGRATDILIINRAPD